MILDIQLGNIIKKKNQPPEQEGRSKNNLFLKSHTKSLHCFPQNVCIIFSTKVSGWSKSGLLLNKNKHMYIV